MSHMAADLRMHRSGPVSMSVVLHVYEPLTSSELCQYLDAQHCDLAVSFDEAPKLSHSIAIELDEALDAADLGDGSMGTTIIISEAEDMHVGEACLSALGCPEESIVVSRDYDQHRLVGFCCSPDADPGDSLTLINGERTAGFGSTPGEWRPILDATAVLADELDEHFEFTATDARQDVVVAVYGGRAPDGCIVGVLGMRSCNSAACNQSV